MEKKGIIKLNIFSSVLRLIIESKKAYIKNDNQKSRKYIKMANELIKKNRIRIDREIRSNYCKKCFFLLTKNRALVIYDWKNKFLRVFCICGGKKII